MVAPIAATSARAAAQPAAVAGLAVVLRAMAGEMVQRVFWVAAAAMLAMGARASLTVGLAAVCPCAAELCACRVPASAFVRQFAEPR